jgi:hypothetical protein
MIPQILADPFRPRRGRNRCVQPREESGNGSLQSHKPNSAGTPVRGVEQTHQLSLGGSTSAHLAREG